MNLKKSLLFSISILALAGAGSMVNQNSVHASNVTYNTRAKQHNIQAASAWKEGIPKSISSVNGWISNTYHSNLSNKDERYVRYTTPFDNDGYYSEGFNARSHYYKYRNQYMGNQTNYGPTTGAKNSQARAFYRYLGHNYYNIISGNNFRNGLKDDLDMYNHPKKTTFYTPTFVTVKVLGKNSIKVWNRSKFEGIYHRMSEKVANQLGYFD